MSVRDAAAPATDPQGTPPMAAILANALRRLMGRSQHTCRLRRVAPTVQLKRYERLVEGRKRSKVVIDGVATCKSRLCPLCVGQWERTRAAEITQAIENHGAWRSVFATFTNSHHRGQPLALLHRIQRHAYGNMWSGRRGQAAARRIGGRPESVRAHDLTWSLEHGWHPHLHCILFLPYGCHNLEKLHRILDQRWRESLVSTLRSLKHSLIKVMMRVPCEFGCAECRARGECPVLRERVVKLFGTKLIRAKNSRGEDTKLLDEARRVLRLLAVFDEKSVQPSVAHGVKVEQVHDEKGIGTYLAKLGAMGFELASASTKRLGAEGADEWGLGHFGSDKRIRHYGLWEVARVCSIHGHPLRVQARRDWRELYNATFGTQTITFSDREELGLGPDEYPDEGELPRVDEPTLPAGEFTSLVGTIAGKVWDGMARQQGHGLLVTIAEAERLGLLEELPQLDPPQTFMAATPATGPPPERGPPPPTPAERLERLAEHWIAGRAFWADVTAELRARDVPIDWIFMEEVREKLWRDNASTERARREQRAGVDSGQA